MSAKAGMATVFGDVRFCGADIGKRGGSVG
jgi:hypothetical protein